MLQTLFLRCRRRGSVWANRLSTSIPEQFESSKENYIKAIALERLCKKQKMDSKQYLTLLKTIKKQIKTIENDDMYQLVTMTMPSALKIMRDEDLEHLNTLQEEGKEITEKANYTQI